MSNYKNIPLSVKLDAAISPSVYVVFFLTYALSKSMNGIFKSILVGLLFSIMTHTLSRIVFKKHYKKRKDRIYQKYIKKRIDKDVKKNMKEAAKQPITYTDEELVNVAIFAYKNRDKKFVSIGLIQRALMIGFNKTIMILDKLVELGAVAKLNEHQYTLIADKQGLIAIFKMHNLPIPKKQPNSEHQTEPLQISANFDIMEGHDFEYFCADILRKNGFTNVQVTQGSGDYGIDILAKKDDIKYAIQCKCYSGNIGNGAVQEAHSGKDIYNCDVGVVMTNRYFTKSAIETAQAHKIKLWDRDKLLEFIRNAEQTK